MQMMVTTMKTFRYIPVKSVVLALILALSITTPFAQVLAAEFEVKLRSIEDHKAVFAMVESIDQTRARTRIGGTVSELTIDEGSQVVAGQKIARITDKKLPLKLASLDAKLSSLTAQRKLAETDLERAKSLRRTGAASQARLDETLTRLDIVKSEIASLKAEESIVLQEVKDGDVLAPASGRVLSVMTTNGSVILPGETVATIAKEQYILRLRLPERHARFLQVGERVQVGARGMMVAANSLTDATVQQVYPELENGRVIADVKVSGLGTYFVGERTPVHIATGPRQVIAAPRQFFYQRYGIAFGKLKDGGEVTVRLGLPVIDGQDDEIEVLSGLKPGDVLVTP